MERRNTLYMLLFIIALMISLNKCKAISQQEVYNEILKHDMKFPKVVLAQSLLETGYYRCTNCSWRWNNLFGYGWDGKDYYHYDHWRDSVANLARWQKKRYKGGDYFEFLTKVGYAQAKNYIRDLKWILKNKVTV